MGCDSTASRCSSSTPGFNPRTRVGCDASFPARITPGWCVSIHAPAWGATCADRTRTGRTPVSIHAPAWGATPESRLVWAVPEVSIHAPAWGATLLTGLQRRAVYVSIHAPAWGATYAIPLAEFLTLLVSIHAPAWGATLKAFCQQHRICMFQSTHPRGVRPGPETSAFTLSASFNPRTRVGCDTQNMRGHKRDWHVSIHAPAWGATRRRSVMGDLVLLFQSTHPRGVRRAHACSRLLR